MRKKSQNASTKMDGHRLIEIHWMISILHILIAFLFVWFFFHYKVWFSFDLSHNERHDMYIVTGSCQFFPSVIFFSMLHLMICSCAVWFIFVCPLQCCKQLNEIMSSVIMCGILKYFEIGKSVNLFCMILPSNLKYDTSILGYFLNYYSIELQNHS